MFGNTEDKGKKKISLREELDRASKRIPKTQDSQGEEYYLGLTPGQIITVWWGEHQGLCNKVGMDIKNGCSNEEILEKYGKDFPELMVDQLEWLRNRFWIEASRIEEE